jgi:hypothetical protein
MTIRAAWATDQRGRTGWDEPSGRPGPDRHAQPPEGEGCGAAVLLAAGRFPTAAGQGRLLADQAKGPPAKRSRYDPSRTSQR